MLREGRQLRNSSSETLFLQMLAKITEFKKCFVTSPSLKRLQIGLCTLTRIYLASLTYNDSVFLVIETE